MFDGVVIVGGGELEGGSWTEVRSKSNEGWKDVVGAKLNDGLDRGLIDRLYIAEEVTRCCLSGEGWTGVGNMRWGALQTGAYGCWKDVARWLEVN
jgi:hypothetical protein